MEVRNLMHLSEWKVEQRIENNNKQTILKNMNININTHANICANLEKDCIIIIDINGTIISNNIIVTTQIILLLL